MKILAIDDQQLVLLALKKRLELLGYEVITTNDASNVLDHIITHEPNLVILDLNMPNFSGIDVIKRIKNSMYSETPIMVLSGNTQEDLMNEAFKLGINDYVKKPISMNEIGIRVKNLIGGEQEKLKELSLDKTLINRNCIGVVIPCYNEENRLLSDQFLQFLNNNTGYHLCFVNDGSKDNTLQVLEDLKRGREDHISIYNCQKNMGKAEAVRQGMLYMAKRTDLDYIGFLDADLSTDLKDFDDLVETISSSSFKIVSGSRISRMGANITKQSARKLISLTINFIITRILSMDFKDTQCGAKIFDKEIINIAFDRPFITKWIFDVEIFKRVAQHYGINKARTILCEQPLKRWIHADGSKLSMKDSIKIIFQLAKIIWVYRNRVSIGLVEKEFEYIHLKQAEI